MLCKVCEARRVKESIEAAEPKEGARKVKFKEKDSE